MTTITNILPENDHGRDGKFSFSPDRSVSKFLSFITIKVKFSEI